MPVLRELGRGGTQVFQLGACEVIGRGRESTIHIADGMVSHRHAQVRCTPHGEVWIADLGSKHGTLVAGKRIGEALLHHGDQILVGNTRLRFEDRPMTEELLGEALSVRAATLLESTFRPASTISEPSELSRDYERLRVAFELTRAIGVEHDPAALIDRVLDTALRLFRGDRAAIALLDGAGNPTAQLAKLRTGEPVEMPLSSRMLCEVLTTRGGLIITNASTDERFKLSDSVTALRICSAMCVPIVYQDELLGVLQLDSTSTSHAFNEKDLDLFTAIASQAAMAIKNAKLVARVQAVIAEDWRRLERVIHALPAGVLLLDAESRLTLTNSLADRLLPSISEAKRGEVLAHIGGASIRELLEGGGSRSAEVTTSDTRPRTFSIAAAHTTGETATEEETVIVVREVTEERLREAHENQQEKLALIGQLAGGVAHDFNNLLGVILNYADFVHDAVTDEEVRRDIEQIKDAGMRAAELTKQLLAVSRREMISPRVFDLDHLVVTMGRMMQRTLGEHIVFRSVPSREPLPVKADPSRIEQVLMNLLVNARDAMPHGGTLTVGCTLVELGEHDAVRLSLASGAYAVLSVTDTGVGMPADVMSHIFEPFFTTKERGKGTGLGLASASGIVEQVGGHISVSSSAGVGTTFQVMLPITDERMASESSNAKLPLAHGRETVLVVEDEPGVRQLTRRILDQAGYRVIDAPDGERALELLAAQRGEIDLLLTDLVMPGMSGKELAERATAQQPGLHVLYMSGYIDRDVAGQGLFAKDRKLLTKPFSRDALLDHLRAALPAR
jgi:signal transduction histidine kinase/pSer/pThr/pTyr-binding forkhead associated (FHA) protein/ActR/RegA family two-component response regulator